jgi:hypothetical protein
MRRWSSVVAVAVGLASLTLAACGSESEADTPVACLGSAGTYLRALEAAPGEVRLDGDTPISGCLVSEQDAGQLAQVGKSVIAAATELNDEVRRTDGEQATIELGYLVGAVQEGASATSGIHQDLVRRLDAAARYIPGGGTFPVEIERVFNRGYAAGQKAG